MLAAERGTLWLKAIRCWWGHLVIANMGPLGTEEVVSYVAEGYGLSLNRDPVLWLQVCALL